MACVTKKKGRWAVDFYDQHGKRRLKTLPKDATKAEARKLLREIEQEVEQRKWMPTKSIPTFPEVAQEWLEYKKPNVRFSSWDGYRGHVDHHFHDFNGLKINRITTASVEKFIRKKQEAGTHIGTLRKIIVTLNQIVKYAVRHNYLAHNPVRDAERPKRSQHVDEKQKTHADFKILTPSQITALFDAVSNPKYKTLFMLAVMGGLRQGELLGSKWSDLDLQNNQIHVQRTYNKKTWYKPKSKTSDRRVDLGPAMIKALKKWKLACPPNKLDLIFPSEAGNPLQEACMVRRYYKPALEKAEAPKIRFYDLRHTYASLLIEQGENIKYIQNQLGHSSPVVTLEVYAHLMKPVNQEAAIRLENQVFEVNGDHMETKHEKQEVNVTSKGK